MGGKRGRERQKLRQIVKEGAALNRARRRKRRANAIADKELTAEAADNFRGYLSILREWEAKEKLDL